HKAEIKHFFEQYKALEPGKEVLPGDFWAGVEQAEKEIVAARKRLEESEK
ncbi:inorganic pyrophosphatase, partial [Bifidobacteriaceae bacterium WP022]